jgi:thiamine biosynthesis lipoprotein
MNPFRPVVMLCAAALLAGCVRTPVREAAVATLHGATMGTTWTVKLVRPHGVTVAALDRGIQTEVDRVVAQMSTYEPDSDLVRFNRAPPGTWQTLPPEFFTVLRSALARARDTGGAYDPTVGPLVDLWGFGPGPHEHRVPSDAAIAAARVRVGWERIRLDEANRRAFQPGGVRIDLSSIAKGFGTDQIAHFLDRAGVTAYLVDISGELRARGRRPDGRDWQVGIERPGAAAGAVDAPGQIARVVALRDRSIATSGDYRHFFEDGGRFYSHHIDPRTGRPVPHRIASVTTIARDCMEADAAGTAMMVLGPDEGMAWAERRGLAVLMILRDGDGFRERRSSAFARVAP